MLYPGSIMALGTLGPNRRTKPELLTVVAGFSALINEAYMEMSFAGYPFTCRVWKGAVRKSSSPNFFGPRICHLAKERACQGLD